MTGFLILAFAVGLAGSIYGLHGIFTSERTPSRCDSSRMNQQLNKSLQRERDAEDRHLIAMGMAAQRVADESENVVFLYDHKTRNRARPYGADHTKNAAN